MLDYLGNNKDIHKTSFAYKVTFTCCKAQNIYKGLSVSTAHMHGHMP